MANRQNSARPLPRANPARKQDTMKKAAPGNDAAPSTKQAGRPPMDNNTTKRAFKTPDTIGGNQQIAVKARKQRAANNKRLREITRQKTALNNQYKKLESNKRTLANAIKAAELKNDTKTAQKLSTQYSSTVDKININARQRGGLTRSETATAQKRARADYVISVSNERIDSIREERARKAQVKTPVSKESDRNQSAVDTESTVDTEHTPQTYTTKGGDVLEDDTDRPEDIRAVYDWTDDVDDAADIVLDYFSKQPHTPQRRHQYRNKAARNLSQLEARGIKVQFNGEEVPAIEALLKGMNPGLWWTQVKDLFDTYADGFPYKGIAGMR